MRNVRSRILLSLLFTGFAALTACNDPDVSIGTLGKKLSAPVLSGTSPFDQDFDTNNYVHITGTCDNRVGDLSVSFILSAKNTSSSATTTTTTDAATLIASAAQWHTPPTNPDVTNTTLATTTVNDANCADGSFDFYLTKNDITSLWGFDPNSDVVSVDQIQMKGSTLIGDTKVLTLIDPHSSNNTVASKIVIEKQWPRGFAGSDRCESFNVYLTDGNGNYSSASSAVSFSVSQAIGGGTASNLFAYSNWDDCNNYATVAGVQTFAIPAGQNSTQVIVRMPADSSDFNQTFSYKAVSSGLTSGSAETMILRDGSSTSLRWVARDPNMAIRPHKDICYALNFNRYLYTGALDTTGGGGVTFSLNPSDTNLKFYSDSSCSNSVSSLMFGTSSSTANAYVKYNSTGTESSNDSLRVNVTMTSTATGYDFAPFYLDIDTSSSATVTQLQLMGPNELVRGQCNAYMVSRDNNHYSPIPDTSTLLVTISSTATGSVYMDSSCTGTTQSTVPISAGQESAFFYFKTTDSNTTAGTYSIGAQATGLTSAIQNFDLKIMPSNYSIGIDSAVSPNVCTGATISLMDNLGVTSATSDIGFSYSLLSGLSDLNTAVLYTDSNCTTAISIGTVATLSPVSSSYYRFYIKTADSSSSTYFTIQTSIVYGSSTFSRSNTVSIQR